MKFCKLRHVGVSQFYVHFQARNFVTASQNVQTAVPKYYALKPCLQSRKYSKNEVEISSILKNRNLAKYINEVLEQYNNRHFESHSEQLAKSGLTLRQLENVQQLIQTLHQTNDNIFSLKDLKNSESSNEGNFVQLLEDELQQYEEKLDLIEDQIVNELLPNDETEYCNGINLEITAGVGGQEAMLFAKNLFDLYCNYCAFKNWSYELTDMSETDLGGLKSCSIAVTGTNCYSLFCLEAGVHRVQRIPKTERSGRMHTSTATVAILPIPSETDIIIKDSDLKIETKQSRGPGGQHVNKIQSAVRIHHLPTGLIVYCEVHREQNRNKTLALDKLRAMLYSTECEKKNSSIKHIRKNQIGTASRNEKVRTYNFQQDRITDHRFNKTLHNLDSYFEGSEYFDNFLQELSETYKRQTKEHFLQSLRSS